METQPESIKNRIFAFLEHAWGYTGTLAVLSLLLGVLGMGLYHITYSDAEDEYDSGVVRSMFFTGMVNPSEPLPPEGVGILPLDEKQLKGAPYIRLDYSDMGKCMRAVHIGESGMPAPLPGSRVAEQRIRYDAAGHVLSKTNYDAQGAPVEDASGVAVREFEYDASGRLVRRLFKNAEGKAVVPRMPGFAEQRIRYDSQNRPVSITHHDGTGRPISNVKGENELRFEYDASGRQRKCTNYVGGKPHNNAFGFAVEKKRDTEDSLSSHTSWMDEKLTPVAHPQSGAFGVLEYYTPSTRAVRTRMCAADGAVLQHSRSCSEHVMRKDADGRIEWECFQGADGMPCNNDALGYAERVCEYADNGNLLREYFWDAKGNPAPCYEKRHIAQGGAHYVLSLHADGSTSVCAEP